MGDSDPGESMSPVGYGSEDPRLRVRRRAQRRASGVGPEDVGAEGAGAPRVAVRFSHSGPASGSSTAVATRAVAPTSLGVDRSSSLDSRARALGLGTGTRSRRAVAPAPLALAPLGMGNGLDSAAPLRGWGVAGWGLGFRVSR